MPTNIVAPVYSTTIWKQIGTYDCSTNHSTNTETVTYSVGGVFWTNFSSPYTNFPDKVTNAFSAKACVFVTSSSTTNCASPGLVTIGNVSWDVPCPTINNLTIDRCGVLGSVLEHGIRVPLLGAVIHYNFQCADGWYSWETNGFTQNCDTTDSTTAQLTTATSDPWYFTGDYVANTVVNPSALPCSMVSQQTLFFAPVGGGSISNNNSTCSFNFTRTLTISPNSQNPGHGTVTLVVTGLANAVTNQCNY
jgi:hypothetical protein